MKESIRCRVLEGAQFIAATGATVRTAARKMGVSKSTVHKDMEERLRLIDLPLYEKVRAVMSRNKAERHLRGGAATSAHFRRIRQAAGREENRAKRSGAKRQIPAP